MAQCSCHSGKAYAACCQPWHRGQPATNALALMRSRYCAYARHDADYIIRTTHPNNPSFSLDAPTWKQNILQFCLHTRFLGLEIHEFIDGQEEAFVTFTAKLEQNGSDATFREKSRFLKTASGWLYEKGEFVNNA